MSGYIALAPKRGWFETARTKAFGAIVDAYSAIGTPIDHPTRIFIINNTTNKDAWISLDGTNNHFAIVAGGNLLIDDATNGISISKGTTFYAKRYTPGDAPTSGDIIVSIGYKV